jgi:hypothetical protein
VFLFQQFYKITLIATMWLLVCRRLSGHLVCKNLEVDLNEEESFQFAASQAAVKNGIATAMTILKKDGKLYKI